MLRVRLVQVLPAPVRAARMASVASPESNHDGSFASIDLRATDLSQEPSETPFEISSRNQAIPRAIRKRR
jgi:hypothetical protein